MGILRIHSARVLRIHGLNVLGIHNGRIHVWIIKIEKWLRPIRIQISLPTSCIGDTFLRLVDSFIIIVLLDRLFHIIFGRIEKVVDTYIRRLISFDQCGFISRDNCGNIRFLVKMAELTPNFFKRTFLSFYNKNGISFL